MVARVCGSTATDELAGGGGGGHRHWLGVLQQAGKHLGFYKLYADSAVNVYYFVMSVYGWYHWTHRNGQVDERPITRSSRTEHLVSASVFIGSFTILYLILTHFTDSDVPIWDALTTAAAVTAMWLMARKKVEHWIFWLICNFISMPLYPYKGLPFTSFQFFMFTVLAVMGWVSWRRKVDG